MYQQRKAKEEQEHVQETVQTYHSNNIAHDKVALLNKQKCIKRYNRKNSILSKTVCI